jgi:hypothetical protein
MFAPQESIRRSESIAVTPCLGRIFDATHREKSNKTVEDNSLQLSLVVYS